MTVQKTKTRGGGGLLLALLLSPILTPVAAASTGECAPVTWENPKTLDTIARPLPTCAPRPFKSASVAAVGKGIKTGEVNCRYWVATPHHHVDQQTCGQLAQKWMISDEHFYMLNPDVDPGCRNIRANTNYCVEGFIEPLRATLTGGRCGPPNGNATCKGYQLKQCCNSETWMCGDSDEDCAKGTCYEGICFGDKVYSTDGTCGEQHGNRLCAGKWGSCCRAADGVCGDGDGFCGKGVCQSGDCY